MQLKSVSAAFHVADQINADDIVTLAAKGIRSIICNRPDGEGADQPNVTEIEHAAEAHGIIVQSLPVTSDEVSDKQAAEFKVLYHTMPESHYWPIAAQVHTRSRYGRGSSRNRSRHR